MHPDRSVPHATVRGSGLAEVLHWLLLLCARLAVRPAGPPGLAQGRVGLPELSKRAGRGHLRLPRAAYGQVEA